MEQKSSINNGYYTNILYLAFKWSKSKQIFEITDNKVAIEGPIPVCEKIFNKTLNCDFINPSSIQEYFPTLNYKFHDKLIEKSNILSSIHEKYDSIWEPNKEIICEIKGTDDILNIENNGDFYLGNIFTEIEARMTGADISLFNTKLLSDTWNPGFLPKYKINSLINIKSK